MNMKERLRESAEWMKKMIDKFHKKDHDMIQQYRAKK